MEDIKQSETELRYCLRLVRDGRTAEVGSAVASYLDTQAASARVDSRVRDAAAYADAAQLWRADRRAQALERLALRLLHLTTYSER